MFWGIVCLIWFRRSPVQSWFFTCAMCHHSSHFSQVTSYTQCTCRWFFSRSCSSSTLWVSRDSSLRQSCWSCKWTPLLASVLYCHPGSSATKLDQHPRFSFVCEFLVICFPAVRMVDRYSCFGWSCTFSRMLYSPIQTILIVKSTLTTGKAGVSFQATLKPYSQEWSISNFPSCSLTRNITPHSMRNLAFHSSLRWKMIILPILTISLINFCLNGWENFTC